MYFTFSPFKSLMLIILHDSKCDHAWKNAAKHILLLSMSHYICFLSFVCLFQGTKEMGWAGVAKLFLLLPAIATAKGKILWLFVLDIPLASIFVSCVQLILQLKLGRVICRRATRWAKFATVLAPWNHFLNKRIFCCLLITFFHLPMHMYIKINLYF